MTHRVALVLDDDDHALLVELATGQKRKIAGMAAYLIHKALDAYRPPHPELKKEQT